MDNGATILTALTTPLWTLRALSGLRNEEAKGGETMKYELTATGGDWLSAGKAGDNAGTVSAFRQRVVTACNQKTNREPVMNLTEQEF